MVIGHITYRSDCFSILCTYVFEENQEESASGETRDPEDDPSESLPPSPGAGPSASDSFGEVSDHLNVSSTCSSSAPTPPAVQGTCIYFLLCTMHRIMCELHINFISNRTLFT